MLDRFSERRIPDHMQLQVIANHARQWNGLEAALYESTGGPTVTAAAPFHRLAMHAGAPVRAHCRIDGRSQKRLQIPGDIDVVPGGYPAMWEDDRPTTLLSLRLSPALIARAAEALGLDPASVSPIPALQLRDPQIEYLCWALKAELEADQPSDAIYAESLGLALAVRLLQKHTPRATIGSARGLSKRQLRAVMDYIDDTLDGDLSLATLAKQVRLSPSHFSVLFKRAARMPVHQYVVRRRLDVAVALLSGGRHTIAEVALRTGFADQSHLARCMRRELGVTPRAVQAQAV